MPGKIKFTKPVSRESAKQPTINVGMRGKYQNDYFYLRRIALDDFGVTQTELARLVLIDFCRLHRERKKADPGAVEQMRMRLWAMEAGGKRAREVE